MGPRESTLDPDRLRDVIVVGAGPNGIATALHAQRRGLDVTIIEQGTIGGNIVRFPLGMLMLGARPAQELAGIPLDSPRSHPTREDMLSYLLRLVRLASLEVLTHARMASLDGTAGDFVVHTVHRDHGAARLRARALVVATGVFGQPRRLDVPGSKRPNVHYGYRDVFDFARQSVVVVGDGNGAAEAALRLHLEAHARVTVVGKRAEIEASKWRWHTGELVGLVRTDAIRFIGPATVERIESGRLVVDTGGTRESIDNDAVIVLVGYEPDLALFDALGVSYDENLAPVLDRHTLESSRRGVYVAGVACGGREEQLLIPVGRNHGKAIVAHLLGEPSPIDGSLQGFAYWRQFASLADPPSPHLVRRMLPVVTGEFPHDVLDVVWARLARESSAEPLARASERPAPVMGAVLDELPEPLLKVDKGGYLYKGIKLSEQGMDLLRLADGTRTIADITREVSSRYDEPEIELETLVTTLLLGLMRKGALAWRS